jgi:hypothetical protein
MKTLAQLPFRFLSTASLTLAAIVAVASGISCSQTPQVAPPPTPTPKTKTYTCKDRPIKIDKNYNHGVDKDPVVVCVGNYVSWSGQHGWKVSFTTSPFVDPNLTDIDDSTDPSKLVIKDVGADDAAFKYSVTPAGGKKIDPQIIVMGGS